MLLKRGIRENSGGIEVSKNMIRLKSVARNMQWRGAVSGNWGKNPHRSKILYFFAK